MITDAQTNFVWFSELLRRKPEYQLFNEQLTAILQRYRIAHDFLQETNDIWCRDYMPIQVNQDKYVEFRFDPDYLLSKKWRSYKTYADLVCETMGLKVVKSDILLDGGNVIRGGNWAILTDKVVVENRLHYTSDRLIGKLTELFEVDKVILIPWDKTERYGHADGMIRFIDNSHVLINGYFRDYDPKFRNSFLGALDKNGLAFTELKFNCEKPNEDLNWGYINYLQMENLLLLPQFGIAEDRQALEQISLIFPEYAVKGQIETIDSNSIIRHGGVLNCVSWNIKQ
ncbi:MAG: agmatine deiminase family protein [Bacteroidetes bacterium]|nr:agmatine deiminase family protein [Bacteroidota bacterium]